jgi:hypothetical protein
MTLPAIPAPRTWAPGDDVLAPQMRADVSDAVAFLVSRPFFAGQNTGQTFGTGGPFNLGLNIELDDPWNAHDFTGTVANSLSSQIWCQAPGWYLAHVYLPYNYTGSTQYQFAAGLTWTNNGVTQTPVNGGLLLCGSTHGPVAKCTDLIPQTVAGPIGGSGDWIGTVSSQNTGGNVQFAYSSTLAATTTTRWVCALTGTQPLPVPPLATVPSPLTSAWMNANVRDTINFLIYPPVCKVTLTGSHTLASSTFPAGNYVPFNSVTFDNYGGFTTGSTAVYTAPVAGRYYVYGQFNLAAASSTALYGAGIIVNGGTTQWGDVIYKTSDSYGGGATVGKQIRLNAGDTVGLVSTQNSGSTISFNTAAANQTRFIVCWEGA